MYIVYVGRRPYFTGKILSILSNHTEDLFQVYNMEELFNVILYFFYKQKKSFIVLTLNNLGETIMELLS